MIGLKRGKVILAEHNSNWSEIATKTIQKLKKTLGECAIDIQHVGSTSIKRIKAKPIIDLAVGVEKLEDVYPFVSLLEENGFIHKPENDNEWQVFFSCGDFEKDIRTHHIHVVVNNSPEWKGYIKFRDYLNTNYQSAKEYEELKLNLMKKYSNDRNTYTDSKGDFIKGILRR